LIFNFSLCTFAKKVENSFSIQMSLEEQTEKISLLIYNNKIELLSNSNRWSSDEKIGLFTIKDKKIIERIKNKIHPFTIVKQYGPTKFASKHSSQVLINGKRITHQSNHYENIISLFYLIRQIYPWQNTDEIKLDNGSFVSSKSPTNKISTKCFSNRISNKRKLSCRSKFGVIHTERILLNKKK
jgi:hypothetical protein